ncbi:MAG: hypothetical protein GWN99_00340 [Gemmatimonadetes bacterium]|uniref:Outer membrane protein beta-barrel domain-containing protein n=1 Tax=Candidatus Kutchimonas denitrificans TaxID=3056748 RepID=A0AAE4Z8S9_9BACT|nr:hypothetical protein [Gemmatimonadota bacterium]NIR73556.1 hypothetical protein [Candidatus Kutchimonas denitrificans]NIR99515.1 hypothetical protein [Gemmatimonadota bacterium]NIT65135.1 hypothetical protein [Gemmatimonadota bacterium]NIV23668.1 hypothetical protein [Gemmatimonadota bacterium]
MAEAQESRSASQLGVSPASVAATGAADISPSPTFSEPAVWVEGAASRETTENAAVEFVSALFRMSDVQTLRENPAAGLKLRYEAAEFALPLSVTDESPLQFYADFGVGMTRLRSQELGAFPISGYYRFSETFFSAVGGVTAKLRLADGWQLFIGARRFLYLNDADRIQLDEVPDTEKLLDTSSWTFPFTLGFELSFD